MKQEKKIKKSVEPVSISATKIILNQMMFCICKIKINANYGTGFFCKISIDKNITKNFLMTNYHILDEKYSKKNKKINLLLNDEKEIKTIDLKIQRNVYYNKENDITLIELKDNDNINNFLELDDKLFINNNEIIYENKSLYVLQYPQGRNAAVSFGLLTSIDNLEIKHTCSTEYGSSGSPILNLETNKVIGIHKEGSINFEFNKGTYLKNILIDFIQKNKKIIENQKKNILYKQFNNNTWKNKKNLFNRLNKSYDKLPINLNINNINGNNNNDFNKKHLLYNKTQKNIKSIFNKYSNRIHDNNININIKNNNFPLFSKYNNKDYNLNTNKNMMYLNKNKKKDEDSGKHIKKVKNQGINFLRKAETPQDKEKGNNKNKYEQNLFNDYLKKLMKVESQIEDAKFILGKNTDFNCEDAFCFFESDDKGYLNKNDIKNGLNAINIYPTDIELRILMKRFDLQKNNFINYADFFDMIVPFEKHLRTEIENRQPESPYNFSEKTKNDLKSLFNFIIQSENDINNNRRLFGLLRLKLKEILSLVDKTGKGFFNFDEMMVYLANNNILENNKEADLLFIRLDKNRNGKIDFPLIDEELQTLY